MLRPRRLRVLLTVAALLLAAVAVWSWLDNPTISGTSRGDQYLCDAPYDTVLNDSDNVPGGERAPDEGDMATRCAHAGRVRFAQGVVSGAAAVVVGGSTVVLRRRRTSRSAQLVSGGAEGP